MVLSLGPSLTDRESDLAPGLSPPHRPVTPGALNPPPAVSSRQTPGQLRRRRPLPLPFLPRRRCQIMQLNQGFLHSDAYSQAHLAPLLLTCKLGPLKLPLAFCMFLTCKLGSRGLTFDHGPSQALRGERYFGGCCKLHEIRK